MLIKINILKILKQIKKYFVIIKNIRRKHSSWDSPSGLILFGGRSSRNSSEKIQEGNSIDNFELTYDTR